MQAQKNSPVLFHTWSGGEAEGEGGGEEGGKEVKGERGLGPVFGSILVLKLRLDLPKFDPRGIPSKSQS